MAWKQSTPYPPLGPSPLPPILFMDGELVAQEKPIDKEEFEKLCAMWATEKEIAAWFDCSVERVSYWCKKTYDAPFIDVYSQKSNKGRVALRRAQLQAALEGDRTMMIWLGKQKLDQSDKNETHVTVNQATVTDVGDIYAKYDKTSER